jgi:predicted transcriptional regulator
MNAHSALMRLGFSEYEARAYTALVQRSPLNGYEIAKDSGVPRANIYAVLDKLMARNAIKRFESAGGTRYTAVDPTKLTRNLAREHDRTLREAERSLESISAPPAFDYVWNAEGYDAFLARARATIASAKKDLVVAVSPPEAAALGADLAARGESGVRITTLCLNGCLVKCDGCTEPVYRFKIVEGTEKRWAVIVADGQDFVGASIATSANTLVLTTQHPLLIELALSYVRNTIAIGRVVADIGDRLDDILTPQTKEIIAALGPLDSGGGFLEHVRELIASSPM